MAGDRQELEELRRLEALEAKAAGSRTPLERAGRVAGLGARAAITGVSAIPTLMAEGAAGIGNVQLSALEKMGVPVSYRIPSPSQSLQQTLTSAGLPAPENAIERVSSDVVSGMSGMGAQLGVLSRMPGQIAQTLTQQPARQMVASATGPGAASVAREAGAGPVGQFAAGAVGSMAPFAPQVMASRPSPEQLRTAQTIKSGREAGYVLPPTTANPTLTNRILEGAAGKVTTAQSASTKNQTVTNNLVKQDLGIPKNEAITTSKLSSIRSAAGQDYKNVANFGQFRADPQFSADLQRLSATQQVLSQEVPEIANKSILNVVGSLSNKPDFSGRTLIELTKAFRDKATSSFRAGETDAGRFYRGAADAVEDMMERNLQAAGQTDMLNRFRAARATIAKAHTAEAALNNSTGNISAHSLANQLDKGKPLSGGMRKVGEFSTAFPKATQEVEAMGSVNAISPLDVMGATITGAAGYGALGPYGAGLAALYPTIRPATRSMILSGPYQSLMASPNPAPLSRGQAGLLGLLPNLYQPQ